MAFTGPTEDRTAIRELLESYADAVNQRDAEAWGILWCEEASWSLPEETGFGTVEGRKRIVEAWTNAMAYFPNVVFITAVGNIKVDGDRATMRSYTLETYDDPGGQPHRDCGQYDDELVRIDGEWKFRTRRFCHLYRG
jgi:uncharacterized protein (TIGR02246 family)